MFVFFLHLSVDNNLGYFHFLNNIAVNIHIQVCVCVCVYMCTERELDVMLEISMKM